MTNNVAHHKSTGFWNRFSVPSNQPSVPHVFIPKNVPFMIHPDRSQVSPDVFIMQVNKRWHLVDPEVIAAGIQFPGLWKARLYQGMLETGQTVLLPVTKPSSEDYESWHDSITAIIGQARKAWTVIESNPQERCYEVVQTRKDRPQPEWPTTSLDALTERAFNGRIVDLHHPMVMALIGRVERAVFDVEEVDV